MATLTVPESPLAPALLLKIPTLKLLVVILLAFLLAVVLLQATALGET